MSQQEAGKLARMRGAVKSTPFASEKEVVAPVQEVFAQPTLWGERALTVKVTALNREIRDLRQKTFLARALAIVGIVLALVAMLLVAVWR